MFSEQVDHLAGLRSVDESLTFSAHSDAEANVNFRLIYTGPLPSGSNGNSRKREKQAIRRALHPQLKEVFEFNKLSTDKLLTANYMGIEPFYQRGPYRCVPVLNMVEWGEVALDILFLRREAPGRLIQNADIDNRIKVLFDGLRIPSGPEELDNIQPTDCEDPFYCLLQDDCVITEMNVSTDRLYCPRKPSESMSDVHLVIRVRANCTYVGPKVY